MYDSLSVLNAFFRSIDTVTAGGAAKVSDTFTGIRNRFEQVTAVSETAAIGKLSDFVLEGSGKKPLDVENLVTLALGEVAADAQARAEVRQRVAGQVLATLRSEYKETSAEANLVRLGDVLTEAAENLESAVQLCDPDLIPERVIAIEDNEQRKAWNDAPRLNFLVEEALTSLAAAAELLGIQPTSENLFHLVVDATHLERKRPVFTVWDGECGRAGRFAALLQMGARIAPVESLEEFRNRAAEQGRPGPLETRYVRGTDGFGGSRPITVDPDSPDYEEQVALSYTVL
ncbi:hypothetical protein G9E11_12225 [Arthrobacter sp. IA7]|uniref:hypothetical protein n=1 Tax=Arthrobacter ipis TaxID=2716202 RepID=UPI0016827819|nr:hypothetical protein [Arthrobacter ipis]MBD1542998.1 hypothetical protein [Arthrobacter ipis]